jgi:hypothetical protein
MSHKLTKLAIATTLALGSSSAAFAIGDTTKLASLLIFPRIDVSAGNTTLIRITNDGTKGVNLKCYYENHVYTRPTAAPFTLLSGYKNKVDFEVTVTRNQPFWFNAATGTGGTNNQFQVNAFPGAFGDGEPTGVLKCWAVNRDGNGQISFNHLAGEAVIIQAPTDTGTPAITAADQEIYNAWGFQAAGIDGAPVGTPGTLLLNGPEYDACPKYLVGTFRPATVAAVTVTGVTTTTITNPTRLNVASCTQDVRQDNDKHTTKLQLTAWNEYETKFTGAWECANGWHEVFLDNVTLLGANYDASRNGIDVAGANFHRAVLGTDGAYFRVQGVKSSQCDNKAPWLDTTEAVGLVGVLEGAIGTHTIVTPAGTITNFYTDVKTAELHAVNAKSGQILWDAE